MLKIDKLCIPELVIEPKNFQNFYVLLFQVDLCVHQLDIDGINSMQLLLNQHATERVLTINIVLKKKNQY